MTLGSLEKSLRDSNAFHNTVRQTSLQLKDSGGLESFLSEFTSGGFGGMGGGAAKRTSKRGYADFRGWLYSAVNAIAMEGAGQPACVGKLTGADESTQRSMFSSSKNYGDFLRSRMGKSAASKAARTGIELLNSGELYDLTSQPNTVQDRWQFVYSFIANLCLTGWSYLIYDEGEDGRPEMLSVPTTWVTPDHSKGPFSSITVKNPAKPGVEGIPYERNQFAFAHLPNPSDPLSALAPATAQAISIRIDDHIQTSQEAFFHNGIFPSVLVTVGKLPLGEHGGVRPRLTGSQRRQVHGAIRKAMGSIANYGNPGILDGFIERIDRLSATQNEMGWEKSEKTTRLRILSAFAIHPFILGEEMAGSYAQAYTVMERFCSRVNTYLDLLGLVLTNFFADDVQGYGTDNIIWWEPCEPKDPEQERRWWETGANKNFVTQNEYRTRLGLPPDEDTNQQYMDRLMAAEVTKLLTQVGQGTITSDQAFAYLQAFGLPDPLARAMVTRPEVNVVELVEELRHTMEHVRNIPAGLLI